VAAGMTMSMVTATALSTYLLTCSSTTTNKHPTTAVQRVVCL